MSRLHLLAITGLLARGGLLASSGLLAGGRSLLGNGEKREAGQNRKTDRPGNQGLSSHLTAPIQPHQKSKAPVSIPSSVVGTRNSEGESVDKYSKRCCAAATEGCAARWGTGPLKAVIYHCILYLVLTITAIILHNYTRVRGIVGGTAQTAATLFPAVTCGWLPGGLYLPHARYRRETEMVEERSGCARISLR